ncbi:MAG: adenine phosphoribosyltransferase [Gemmatimonadaceae bacterium]
MSLANDLRASIRDVPDFPKPGIIFKDITPVLLDATLFARTVGAMAADFGDDGISHVLAIESRGFLFGAPVALALGAALVPVRKPGKLPFSRVTESYQLEYGKDALELHEDALGSTARVLVVDDLLATGGTAAATCRLAERFGARVVGIAVVIDLGFLPWRSALAERRVVSRVSY